MSDSMDGPLQLRSATAHAEIGGEAKDVGALLRASAIRDDPATVARMAALLGAREAGRILPWSRIAPVEHLAVELDPGSAGIGLSVTVQAFSRDDVDMMALAGASAAALALVDLLRPLGTGFLVRELRLSTGRGRREPWAAGRRAAVLVLSDRVAAGRKQDGAGGLAANCLREFGLEVVDHRAMQKDREETAAALRKYAEEDALDLVLTVGGTGTGPRDLTPEATLDVIDRELPGVAEAARVFGQEHTPFAMLSRGRAGLIGQTIVVNLPGSRGGVSESLSAIFPGLLRAWWKGRRKGKSS